MKISKEDKKQLEQVYKNFTITWLENDEDKDYHYQDVCPLEALLSHHFTLGGVKENAIIIVKNYKNKLHASLVDAINNITLVAVISLVDNNMLAGVQIEWLMEKFGNTKFNKTELVDGDYPTLYNGSGGVLLDGEVVNVKSYSIHEKCIIVENEEQEIFKFTTDEFYTGFIVLG